MGGEQASKVMLQIEVAALKGKGETITPEKEAELLNRIRSKYEETISPYYAASRLWLDAVIDPLETRTWISLGIEAASQSTGDEGVQYGGQPSGSLSTQLAVTTCIAWIR
jgi:3-methylcrotonyl-CoA carboxylase beta subunit